MDIIQIKCPFDGAVLSIKNQPGLESKSVTCPICKNKYPFTRFQRVYAQPQQSSGYQDSNDGEHTQYGGLDMGGQRDQGSTALHTQNLSIGRLTLVGGQIYYQLQPGKNIVGRQGVKSQADFQLNTGQDRALSREHLVVDVMKVPGKGFVHYASLYKEKVNKTYVRNEELYFGDRVVLNDGDLIQLPNVTLKFEIVDNEKTDF